MVAARWQEVDARRATFFTSIKPRRRRWCRGTRSFRPWPNPGFITFAPGLLSPSTTYSRFTSRGERRSCTPKAEDRSSLKGRKLLLADRMTERNYLHGAWQCLLGKHVSSEETKKRWKRTSGTKMRAKRKRSEGGESEWRGWSRE